MSKTKPSGQEPNRTPVRSIRVTEEHWERWRKAAKDQGITITAWLHMLASNECKRKKK